MDRGRGLVERKRPKKTYGLEGDIYLFYLFRFTFFFVSFQTIMSFFIGFFFSFLAFASYNLVLNFSFVFACRNLFI
jgi:hypothetical protein